MTTYEHTMLGINGVLATGLNRRYGWQLAAIAGIAATIPDWDMISLAFGAEVFSAGHRVWGHNIFACTLAGILIGILDYRVDLVTRAGRVMVRMLRLDVEQNAITVRDQFSRRTQIVWILVAVVAAFSQLPADMVVSGTATLSD